VLATVLVLMCNGMLAVLRTLAIRHRIPGEAP
jgi:hypothetical protein